MIKITQLQATSASPCQRVALGDVSSRPQSNSMQRQHPALVGQMLMGEESQEIKNEGGSCLPYLLYRARLLESICSTQNHAVKT